jgi:hypothetical protein
MTAFRLGQGAVYDGKVHNVAHPPNKQPYTETDVYVWLLNDYGRPFPVHTANVTVPRNNEELK